MSEENKAISDRASRSTGGRSSRNSRGPGMSDRNSRGTGNSGGRDSRGTAVSRGTDISQSEDDVEEVMQLARQEKAIRRAHEKQALKN